MTDRPWGRAPRAAGSRASPASIRRGRLLAALLPVCAAAGSPQPAPAQARPAAAQPEGVPRGKQTYDRWCAGCHGATGAGDGAAASRMLPRPRDFTRGVYKIRTTASGEIPTDDDLLRVVADGMPGTAMPSWRGRLGEREMRDVVAYVKRFSTFFAQPARPLAIGDAPAGGDQALADGRATYRTLECFKCHGDAGRGDGRSAPTLKDDWDFPIRAADLTRRWTFRGGSDVRAIYTRLRTGLDGTPMPSFAEAIDQKLITDQQLWHLAAYVRSLSPGEDAAPRVRDVLRAARVTRLPAAPEDPAWEAVEAYWVPLVGQIVVKPRWFAPTVDGIWVRAVHDGARLALRLSWSDPSASPAAGWDEWLGRVARTMTDADGAIATEQGPDRVVLSFAPRATDAELPYFLGGSPRRAAHAWRWSSTGTRVEEGSAQGLGTLAPPPLDARSAPVTHAARHAAGEWRLQLVRALSSPDTARVPAFVPGRAVPVSFFVADGSNGEGLVRGAVSSWYAIHLDVPTPARVYAAPVATALLTAGLGVLLIARAQRREREAGQRSPEVS